LIDLAEICHVGKIFVDRLSSDSTFTVATCILLTKAKDPSFYFMVGLFFTFYLGIIQVCSCLDDLTDLLLGDSISQLLGVLHSEWLFS
jgi:hypothetical protein